MNIKIFIMTQELTTWEIKEPLIIGKYYLVPCYIQEYEKINEIKDSKVKHLIVCPLLPSHKHFDRPEHYHIDNRFVDPNKHHPRHYFVFDTRIENPVIEYVRLKCISDKVICVDQVVEEPVNKKCLNNKCPHLGYDLSQIKPINGVITCPNHGIKICLESMEVVK